MTERMSAAAFLAPTRIVPVTLRQANTFVAEHHRHNKPVRGARFCLGLMIDSDLIGVAIVGRTTARMLHRDTTAEVTRLCVKDGAPLGSCSKLYQAAKRAWQAQGGMKMITYTLECEPGASLRGAGWKPVAKVRAARWTREDRPRDAQPVEAHAKIRWEAR